MKIEDVIAVEVATKWLSGEVLADPAMARAFTRYAANQGGYRWEKWAAARGKVGDDPALALDAALALSAVVTEAHRLELNRLAYAIEVREMCAIEPRVLQDGELPADGV